MNIRNIKVVLSAHGYTWLPYPKVRKTEKTAVTKKEYKYQLVLQIEAPIHNYTFDFWTKKNRSLPSIISLWLFPFQHILVLL